MPMTKIEQTRKLLIEKYGEPKLEMRDGKKYRFVNVNLENFDNMMELIFKLSRQYNITLTEEHIDVFCDFAVNEVQPNVLNVIKKLNRYVARNENLNYGKKAFTRLLDCFQKFRNEEDYSPNYTMNYFVEYLRCSNIYNKGNLRSFM